MAILCEEDRRKEQLELAMFKLVWEYGLVECLNELRDLAIIQSSRANATLQVQQIKSGLVDLAQEVNNE